MMKAFLRGRPERPKSSLVALFVVLSAIIGLASSTPQSARAGHQGVRASDASCCRNASFPSQWTNPITGTTGGSVSVTTNFGAYSKGCSNADTSASYTYYLDT